VTGRRLRHVISLTHRNALVRFLPAVASLLAAASQGKLKEPAVLTQQVRRMLGDSRAQALVDNFAEQWLFLRNLKSVAPNMDAFPDFDDNLRQAMKDETKLFMKSVMDEDRSVMDLLNADYTFVNERLARHYLRFALRPPVAGRPQPPNVKSAFLR